MDFDYDLFVIGAGSGGVRLARMSASYGARVGIAEEEQIGGTCVLRGCIPKKLLVYASHYPHELEDAKGFGWTFGAGTLDWRRYRHSASRSIVPSKPGYPRSAFSSDANTSASPIRP